MSALPVLSSSTLPFSLPTLSTLVSLGPVSCKDRRLGKPSIANTEVADNALIDDGENHAAVTLSQTRVDIAFHFLTRGGV